MFCFKLRVLIFVVSNQFIIYSLYKKIIKKYEHKCFAIEKLVHLKLEISLNQRFKNWTKLASQPVQLATCS